MSTDFLYPGPPKTWPHIQLLRRIMRANAVLRALHKPHFDALDIPMVEFDLLSALGNTAGLRMKELADAMITTPSNVTRVCGVMEAKGLVRRERSNQSDREVIASLTPAGEALFAELFPKTVNFGARLMETALTMEELRAAADLLGKLLAGIEPPEGAGVDGE
ncbi:MAG: hypothetical protein AMXMBFR64_46520 [Myxococcales bacterium]